MKNQESWQPTKYVQRNGNLKASRDPNNVAVSSRLLVDLLAAFYADRLKQHARGRLLDLGCGNVPLYGTYKDLVSDVVCVDWANSAHSHSYLDFECDLTKPLPLPDGSFDTIVLSDVLEHVPSPEFLCREIARLLTSGGKVFMSVPFFYCLHEEPHDYYRYTEFALRRFMDKAGLQITELTPVGGAPEIVTDIFAKNVVLIPGLGSFLAILSQGITKMFVSTRFGKKVSRATAQTFPFEYFVVAEKPAL